MDNVLNDSSEIFKKHWIKVELCDIVMSNNFWNLKYLLVNRILISIQGSVFCIIS